MKLKFARSSSVIFLATALAACGGGGGGGGGDGGGAQMQDDEARRAVLADIGNLVIIPSLESLADETSALAADVATLAASPASGAARSAAQQSWRSAMQAVQRAELFQIGPAAASPEPGSMDLRNQIYAYPLLSECGTHNAAYAQSSIDASTPINTSGMGALEYLLFDDSNNPDCAPGAGVNGQARRAEHASRIADRISVVAADLLDEWQPEGDNFVSEFADAGAGSNTFSTPQMALNALSTAIFYAEKEAKDRKVANPTGVGATGLPACPTVSCPERVESIYAEEASGAHLVANLQAFRDYFTGLSGGMGLNDLLEGVGRGDLATRIVDEINAAISAATALQDSFEAEVAAIPSEAECANAVSARSGEPEACALLGVIDTATDTLRADVVSALNLTIPGSSAGDND